MTLPIRILLVDDHPTMLSGLRSAIEKAPEMNVVGEAGTWQEAYERTTTLQPDVLVLDLNLPDGNGWTLIERLQNQKKLPATLVLSACDEQTYARRLLRSGARGYLMKDEPLSRIVEGIRQVHAGQFVASAALTSNLVQTALAQAEIPAPAQRVNPGVSTLSDRELQIFTLLGEGLRNKDIAGCLGMSDKTVATYKCRLMEKLGLTSTLDLLNRYKDLGLATKKSDQAGQ